MCRNYISTAQGKNDGLRYEVIIFSRDSRKSAPEQLEDPEDLDNDNNMFLSQPFHSYGNQNKIFLVKLSMVMIYH